MNLLLLGSGGREHAIAWKLAQSPQQPRLYALPGNPGIAHHAKLIPGSVTDLDTIVTIARAKAIDLAIIGPEDPLALGLADKLRDAGIPVFGPSQAAAQLEASKAFAKAFMQRHGIPTAEHRTFTDFNEALTHLSRRAPRTPHLPVIKASGLAAGKGVILPATLAEAETALRAIMLDGKFGAAGQAVVIEERLAGREVSLLAFCDGRTAVPMPPAQDHKRLLDGDRGPNTGGMGAFAPSPLPPELIQSILQTAIQPAIDGLRAEGSPFAGVLFAGLILTTDGPKVLEYNVRFGDPETQAILPLLETDLLAIMLACASGELGQMDIRWKDAASTCVVLASAGYPDAYPRGRVIHGIGSLPAGVIAFHAGTADHEGMLTTHGGRVLGVTAVAPSLPEARQLAYEGVSRISFEGMQYRTDIGVNLDRQPMTGDGLPASPASRLPSAYASAGVDIDAGNRAVALLRDAVKSTFTPAVLSDVGSFGGLFSAAGLAGLRDPVLVGTTDGVGTKVSIAAQAGRFRGIGHDIVNHCINDILVQGARPLFFLDYIAASKLDPAMAAEIVTGMAEACRAAGCALLGGETAEMPGVYADGHFDVAGTLIGVVERADILPRGVQAGDVLVGLASSGPHTNGYSLLRKIFAGVPLDRVYPELGIPLADALLAPHRSYLPLLTDHLSRITALAHLTGGGFIENIPRALPPALGVRISRGAWPVPPLWGLVQSLGDVPPLEMFRVFNMGIGMVAIVSPEHVQALQQAIPEETWVIGEVITGVGVLID
jgi:phosphoribosylamine--glycine ligase/phosphoribosylformylglycinamidine cyclo-ligase